MNIDNKNIGQRIREARIIFGLTREEFAEIIELSDYYVGQLERGERQMSLPVMVRIANSLHLSLDYLIFGKKTQDASYAHDSKNDYSINNKEIDLELNTLINKCTYKEIELIKKLIKTILPYLNNK